MAFMTQDDFLRLAARDPWAARGALTHAYANMRGDDGERARLFACAIAAAPGMLETNYGAGDTLVYDLVCWSQDGADKAAQLNDLCLARAKGNRARYWGMVMRRLAQQRDEEPVLPTRRHAGVRQAAAIR